MLEDVFLREIGNNPDDDAVRLVYADWLMEQDEPERRDRGEFIRVQCELARWEGPFRSWAEWAELAPRVPALRKRERYLLAKYGKTWSQPLRELARKCVFRRGFVEVVHVYPDVFIRRAEEVLRLAPIQHVCLHRFYQSHEALAASPCLSRLRGLSLRGHFPPHGLKLLNSPRLNRLTALAFRSCSFAPGVIEALAGSPLLSQLEILRFQSCVLDGEQLGRLAQSARLNPGCRFDFDVGGPITMGLSLLFQEIPNARHPLLLRLALASLRPAAQRLPSSAAGPLLDQLARQPEQVVPILNKALGDPSSAVREAASRFIGYLGEEAIACLPALILRLHDGERRVRSSAAASLCDLIPLLQPEIQRDLCHFANPMCAPSNALAILLGRETLVSVSARRALVARCERRLACHARRSGLTAPPLCSAFASGEEFSHRVINTMVEHAAASKRWTPHRIRQQECAWILARLFEVLHPASATE